MKKAIQSCAILAMVLLGVSGCTNYDATVGLMNAVGIDGVQPREKDPVESWLEHKYKLHQEENTVLHGLVKVRD